MRQLLILFITVLVLVVSCAQPDDKAVGELNHYQIDLTISPIEQFIQASVDLLFIASSDSLDTLTFGLHKQLVLDMVTGNQLVDYQFDTTKAYPLQYMPEARLLSLYFDPPLRIGQRIVITFQYSGKITDRSQWLANVVTDEWVEMGLYLPWFPYNHDYGDFTFKVDVECDSGYQVRSLGDYTKTDAVWHFEWKNPINDIVIVASRELKTTEINRDKYNVNVHYMTVSDSIANKLAEDLIWILALYDNWFGRHKPMELSLIQSPRESGGGYARRGLIVLGGLDDQSYIDNQEAWFRYVSHEAGHLWWTGASVESWEDWLNEGFAEYSALLVVREKFGQEAYERRLAGKRENIEGTKPIWGANRSGSTDDEKREIQAIFYDKGPVLLSELSAKIGYDNFLQICQDMIANHVTSTDQFLTLLSTREGEEVMNWFREMLKTR